MDPLIIVIVAVFFLWYNFFYSNKKDEPNAYEQLTNKNNDKIHRDDMPVAVKSEPVKDVISDDQKSSLVKSILEELSKSPNGLKAITIASRVSKSQKIKIPRKDINSLLYGKSLKNKVYRDSAYKWFLKTKQYVPNGE